MQNQMMNTFKILRAKITNVQYISKILIRCYVFVAYRDGFTDVFTITANH